MKNSIFSLLILAILLPTFILTGCGEVEEPIIDNEEELITSVELTFALTDGNAKTFKFADPDGEGGNDPTRFDTISLLTDTTYSLTVKFLDESKNPSEDITEEVEEEANEHIVCYSTDASTTVTVTDQDGNTLPLGLEADVTTTTAANGTFTVTLKHQPGVKDGTCSPGETDVELAFPFFVL